MNDDGLMAATYGSAVGSYAFESELMVLIALMTGTATILRLLLGILRTWKGLGPNPGLGANLPVRRQRMGTPQVDTQPDGVSTISADTNVCRGERECCTRH